MALVATASTSEPRAHSIGPRRIQVLNCSVASGDTTGTITAPGLTTATDAIVNGVKLSAAPTFSGNVVTLAFADPLATQYFQVIVLGK
jgi:hypothetical protein